MESQKGAAQGDDLQLRRVPSLLWDSNNGKDFSVSAPCGWSGSAHLARGLAKNSSMHCALKALEIQETLP